MKKHDKCLFKTVVCCLSVGLISLSPILELESAKAETITYDDTAAATGKGLQNNPTWLWGRTITDVLYPGTTENPGASGNTVNVDFTTGGGNINPDTVFGGLSENNSVYNNTVNIKAGTMDFVYGGWSNSGNAYGNTVNISGGTITSTVFGGWVESGSGNAYGNTVNISGGTINGWVLGGNVESGSGDAYNNTVNISGGTIAGEVYGGWSGSGNAYANTVNIKAGTMDFVYGGWSGSGDAYNNTVNISGGTIAGEVYGGWSGSGNAYANTVHISGGTIEGYVIGGQSVSGDAYNNTVHISGGTFNRDVGGGWSGTGNAINNQVFLSGAPILTDVSLSGGKSQSSTGDVDQFTGNTLWVLNPIASSVYQIDSFQKYRFLLPNTWSDKPMLTATDIIDLTDEHDSSRIATVDRLGIASGGTMPNIGDKYTLLEATEIRGEFEPYSVVATKGISLLYDMNVAGDNDWSSITATVAGVSVNPQTKALAEGIVSGVAFINQGADLAAGQGMGSALSSANAVGAGNLSSFGAMSAGSSEYETGSHVDVDGFSLMTGLAWNAPLGQNSLVLGGFFEAGWGNYDSYNSFSGRASINGSGDTEYYGGGLLARYSLTEGLFNGLYTEASIRAGYVSTDFTSNDFEDFYGPVTAEYDSSSAYYGAHLGLGYVWQLSEKASLDFSTKYIWTHQEGDSVTVAGDPIKFDAVNSHRWRNGARFSYDFDTKSGMRFTPFIGAAYEHEFDGKASASTYGLSIDAPTLKGGTGVGEIGIGYKPAPKSPFGLNVGMQAYTGVREGVSGNFQLKYEF